MSYLLQDLVLDLPPSVPLDDGSTLALTATRRMLLVALARHADDEGGEDWPAIDLIIEYAGCSRSTALAHLPLLRKAGLVDWTTRRIAGRQATNLYRLNTDRLHALVGKNVKDRPARRAEGRKRKAAAEGARLARRAAEVEHESDAPAGKGAQTAPASGIRSPSPPPERSPRVRNLAPVRVRNLAPNQSSLIQSTDTERDTPSVSLSHGCADAGDGDRSGSPAFKANDTDAAMGEPITDEGSGALAEDDVPARRSALWDALAVEFGQPVTKGDRGRHGRLVAVLLEHGASPADVPERVAMYHRRMPRGSTLTREALGKWWGEVASMPDRPVLARHGPPDADLVAARSGTVRSARARLADLARAQALDVASRPALDTEEPS